MAEPKETSNAMSNQSFQKRLILSYTCILILVLVVGAALYQISYQRIQDGIREQTDVTFASSIRRVDNVLSNISTTAQRASNIVSLRQLTQMKANDSEKLYYQAYTVEKDLKLIFPMDTVTISDSFIYMKNSGYVVSSSKFLNFDSYGRYTLLCPQEKTMLLQNILDGSVGQAMIFSLEEYGSNWPGYLYVYPLASRSVFPGANAAVDAYLCCVIDKDLLEDYFPGDLMGGGYIQATDAKGGVAFTLGSKGEEMEDELLYTEMSSDYNGWKYVLSQPKDERYYSITQYRDLFLMITGLAVALGATAVYIFTILNSKPVIELSNELAIKEEQAFSLSETVEKQRPQVEEAYLRRIMRGENVTQDEISYIAKELKLDREGVCFQVLYMEVYPSESYNLQLDDMALCMQNYDLLVRDALKRYFPDTGYIYKPSDRVFATLLVSPASMEGNQVLPHNVAAFSALHAELLSQYGIWSRGGFGWRNERLNDIWRSYQQAKDAKSITTGEHFIQSYHDYYTNSGDMYYYPEVMAVQLTGAISAGNKDQVMELFGVIEKENDQTRSLSRLQRRQLLADIRSTLFRKRCQLAVSTGSENEADQEKRRKWLDAIDRQYDWEGTGETNLEQLRDLALKLCDGCVQSSSSNELIRKIQEYITKNYHDPSLCLTKISEEFNISENYFSFLFKKETQQNFSDYLENLRMANAKEMVLHSDIGLSNLYQYLGYNNAASFRRVFKKTFGVSPKEMRDQDNGT